MSRSSTAENDTTAERAECPAVRGQTEPLAALVALATVAIAVSVYAAVATDVVTESTDRSVEDPTTDRVWEAISEHGVYDEDDDLEAEIDPETLPQGYVVHVNVTAVDDGGLEVVDRATFGTDGQPVGDSVEVPEHADSTERPISVRRRGGDIDGGRLVVEVWG